MHRQTLAQHAAGQTSVNSAVEIGSSQGAATAAAMAVVAAVAAVAGVAAVAVAAVAVAAAAVAAAVAAATLVKTADAAASTHVPIVDGARGIIPTDANGIGSSSR